VHSLALEGTLALTSCLATDLYKSCSRFITLIFKDRSMVLPLCSRINWFLFFGEIWSRNFVWWMSIWSCWNVGPKSVHSFPVSTHSDQLLIWHLILSWNSSVSDWTSAIETAFKHLLSSAFLLWSITVWNCSCLALIKKVTVFWGYLRNILSLVHCHQFQMLAKRLENE